jgi:nucleoside-diphosphate-sugar epimerase
VDTRLSLVDLRDVAQAAATVLTEPGHKYATYELVGMVGSTQSELAAILSQELGRPVQANFVPLETWQSQASEAGLGAQQIETLTKMFRYYQNFDFLGNTQVLSWLLKRSPTSFSAFVKRTVRERPQEESA